MEPLLFPDEEALARRAADEVAAVVAARPEAVLLLPAGGTPQPLYGELRRRVARGELDLSRAYLVQLDELEGVDPRDGRSFHGFLREHLLARVPRAPGRDLLLDGRTGAPGLELARHGRRLSQLGSIDLALLGLGVNGHVAFNEPGATLADGARVVELAPVTREALAPAFAPAPAPRRGLTLGLREIVGARRVMMLVTGERKSAVLAALCGPEPDPTLPASLLLDHPGLSLLADQAAAGSFAPG